MSNHEIIIEQLMARIRKLERDLNTAVTLGRASIQELREVVADLKGDA